MIKCPNVQAFWLVIPGSGGFVKVKRWVSMCEDSSLRLHPLRQMCSGDGQIVVSDVVRELAIRSPVAVNEPSVEVLRDRQLRLRWRRWWNRGGHARPIRLEHTANAFCCGGRGSEGVVDASTRIDAFGPVGPHAVAIALVLGVCHVRDTGELLDVDVGLSIWNTRRGERLVVFVCCAKHRILVRASRGLRRKLRLWEPNFNNVLGVREPGHRVHRRGPYGAVRRAMCCCGDHQGQEIHDDCGHQMSLSVHVGVRRRWQN